MFLGIGFSNSSAFEVESYIEDAAAVEMLDVQFVKDLESDELKSHLAGFISNYIDKVDHVSGHYAKETDMYYYAIFGEKDGSRTFELVEVDQANFEKDAFVDYKKAAPLFNLCRRGNGYPFPPVCPGTTCQNWPYGGCLGIICSPSQC